MKSYVMGIDFGSTTAKTVILDLKGRIVSSCVAHMGAVSGDGVGTASVNVGSNGAAFGVANNTTMTIMDLLLATDAQAVNGIFYGGNSVKRTEANNVFSVVNEGGSIP